MKKSFVVFLFSVFLSILPCLAANWEQVDDQGKMFIDTTSIKKYNYKYNFGSEKGYYYSFWSKRLNKNDDAGKNLEKILKKKWWYSMDKIIVSCNNEQYAIKSSAFYDLKGEPIVGSSIENIDAMLDWKSIIPGTVGDFEYNYICGPQINYENSNYKNTSSGLKIKDGKSKHWRSI